jgi:hypothetical protein
MGKGVVERKRLRYDVRRRWRDPSVIRLEAVFYKRQGLSWSLAGGEG